MRWATLWLMMTNGNAECREKSGRDGAQLSARIFFTGRADVAVGRKLEARTKAACVSPGNNDAKGDAIHAGQCVDASHRLFVETYDLIRRLSVGNRRHVQREHVMRVDSGLDRLQ